MRPTSRIYVAYGGAQALVAVVALAFGLGGCPAHSPTPAPNNGGTGGSSPAPIVDCQTACAHADAVCLGSGETCLYACPRMPSPADYAGRVMKAADCDGVNQGDPVDPDTGQISTHGR